jgi:hypothetical protein
MLSLPVWLLTLWFIAPPILAYLVFDLIGQRQIFGKLLAKILPGADTRFIRFVEWAILWLLLFGISQLMYTWIRRTLFN